MEDPPGAGVPLESPWRVETLGETIQITRAETFLRVVGQRDKEHEVPELGEGRGQLQPESERAQPDS